MCLYYILQQLSESDYAMFDDSMDSNTLSQIIDLLVWDFAPKGWDFVSHLQGLSTVRRFETLILFLNERDRANIRKLIHECPVDSRDRLARTYSCL